MSNELVVFADEDAPETHTDEHSSVMPSTHKNADAGPPEPWKILIVDDDAEVHAITRLALQHFEYMERPLRILSAYSGAEARDVVRCEADIAMVFLDIIMETPTAGFDLVHFLRSDLHNEAIRIVLRTGQPGTAPEESVILAYDINDYRMKTELTRERLYATLLVSLRTFHQIRTIERQRGELERVYSSLLSQNLELELTRELSEAADKAKTEFLATVSHELRTPLSVILMRAQSLKAGRGGPLTEHQQKSVDTIERSGKQLLTLITELLDIQQGAGDEELVGGACMSIPEMLDDVLEICADELGHVAVAICQDPGSENGDDSLMLTAADAKRLTKALVQLVENAGKFTPAGGNVRIESNFLDGLLEIRIRDTGIGIADGDQERIFDPFTQLESTLTRRFEGTGLGLPIARRLIQEMEGSVRVESSPGTGSCFSIAVPVGEPPSA